MECSLLERNNTILTSFMLREKRIVEVGRKVGDE